MKLDDLTNPDGVTVRQFLEWIKQLPDDQRDGVLSFESGATVRIVRHDSSNVDFDSFIG